MKVSVKTSRFVSAHGKAPKGRGLWAFLIDGHEVFIPGMYTDARIEAAKRAKAMKVNSIELLS